jgi:hypothetical protein
MSEYMIMSCVVLLIALTAGITCFIIASKKSGEAALAWGVAGFLILFIAIMGVGVDVAQHYAPNDKVQDVPVHTEGNCDLPHTPPLETR